VVASFQTTVRSKRDAPSVEGRAASTTTQRALQERQARSTPDALRYTPGVYVQQSAHGQASPYIRGLTGRRTLLLFDGLRINHALFRQGPNQYLFTVDSRTIDRLEVVRGSAGVELGSGAMGGAILAHPIEPRIVRGRAGVHLSPKLSYRHTTADDEEGFRVQVDTQIGGATGLLAGVGYREVGRLESSGPIGGLDPWPSEEHALRWEVPRFEADGRTQLGTGFSELTADGRLVHQLSSEDRLVLASYLYRQLDSPRTDQCPPPETPDHWCLLYEEQFRTHVYARAELTPGWSWARRLDAALGFQRQHERRRNEQLFVTGGVDDINVYEARLRAESAPVELGDGLLLRVVYGLDGSWEAVSSEAWLELDFARLVEGSEQRFVTHFPRGQYVDGSRYARGGAWASTHLSVGQSLELRAGARGALASARAAAQSETQTAGVDDAWASLVGQAGARLAVGGGAALLASVEQGFRPPNLDDLTARQVTGQGYQVANPDLEPERTLTAEVGAEWAGGGVRVSGWLFQTLGWSWMERRDGVCPEVEDPALDPCSGARWAPPVQLDNVSGTALIRGAELEASARLPWGLGARGTLTHAWGEADSPLAHEAGERRPLSRVPPLNGTLEARWRHYETGLSLGAGLRWAAGQARRSWGDENDKRIPPGGTPGYAVLDVRAGLRLPRRLQLNLVLENVTDVAYRIHGSSVNGAARGLLLGVEVEL